jgi:hypothetical protein
MDEQANAERIREQLILAGLYLSKFDKAGLDKLDFKGFTEALNVIGYALGSKPASAKTTAMSSIHSFRIRAKAGGIDRFGRTASRSMSNTATSISGRRSERPQRAVRLGLTDGPGILNCNCTAGQILSVCGAKLPPEAVSRNIP